MFKPISICKGDLCLHAKGEMAQAIAAAIILALLAYAATYALKSLN